AFRISESVAASSPSFVVAAGSDNRAVLYNGTTWTDIGPFSSSSPATIQGLWVSPTNEIFGVGVEAVTFGQRGIIVRYQGNGCSKVVSPGGDLYGIWGFSSS